MTRHRVRLATRAVFVRLFLGLFVLVELAAWAWARRRFRRAFHISILLRVFPRAVIFAALAAGFLTLLAWLAVRLVVRPLVEHWHRPRADDALSEFHLAPGEPVVATMPARRASGWGWRAGTLALTDRRLCFFPAAWDGEPWSRPLAEIRGASLVPAPRVAWGYVVGWPDRFEVRAGEDAPEVFAVADPEAVISWFYPRQPAAPVKAAGVESW